MIYTIYCLPNTPIPYTTCRICVHGVAWGRRTPGPAARRPCARRRLQLRDAGTWGPSRPHTYTISCVYIWGFPKTLGTFLGVPIIRTIVCWGLDWGPPILGNYHMYIYIYIERECMVCSIWYMVYQHKNPTNTHGFWNPPCLRPDKFRIPMFTWSFGPPVSIEDTTAMAMVRMDMGFRFGILRRPKVEPLDGIHVLGSAGNMDGSSYELPSMLRIAGWRYLPLVAAVLLTIL